MLPEWIVRIFMDRYNLNRKQAIKLIEYQDYQRAINSENSEVQ